MIAPGFFTRGVIFELPHKAIDLRQILLVHAVLRRAFALLRQFPPADFDLALAQEDQITFQLHWIIANRLHRSKEIPGFDKRTFVRIEREPKVTNYDGSHLDKMPDLVFWLNRDHLPVLGSHDGLFIECKPVDKAHPAGEDYCDRGLRRFVNRDYAWTMQEAMMGAYVRGGRSITESLVSTLTPRRKALRIVVDIAPIDRSRASKKVEVLQVTTHARDFPWPKGRGPACPIRIFHSWHSCE